ncbi:MAG: tRNA epoxyqueuosine(34) reductase QueG [Gemmatimonadota bacterium]|nr:MAG: tRNA epoxyqueuosine(34) reductase QueG [Gemmatimonadota bacterium]
MTPERRAHLVRERARALGFDTVGVADLSPVPHKAQLERWLAAGLAGTMHYMQRQASRRSEPASIVPGATRVVVLSRNYGRPAVPERTGAGRVARYAQGPDYHTALRSPLDQLVTYLRSLGSGDTVAKAFVDAGPVPERELAQRAGLGWIGKNTMLIDPARGSLFFLASVFTNLELAVDPPFEEDRCGSCTRCLDACPTDAFPEPRLLDSRRCISYLTIEHRGEIAPDLAPLMGDWVFGCDVCQEVCPWNVKFATPTDDAPLRHDPDLAFLDLDELQRLSDEEFQRRYGWTALERPGPAGMARNARIAAENLSTSPS